MSTPRDERIRLVHMVHYARKALEFTAHDDVNRFMASDLEQQAVVRVVEVIGEAARSVPGDHRSLAPEIPWSQIVGLRHRIAHDYMNVNRQVLWEIVRGDLPPLIRSLEALLDKVGRPPSE